MAKPKKPRVPTHKANPEAFFSSAEFAAAAKAKDSAGTRTPKEVLDAFSPVPLKVGELTLRALSLADVMVLERIGSPFADEAFTAETEISAADTMNVVFLLTRTPLECNRLLADGRARFDEAVLGLASRVPFEQVAEVGAKLAKTFATAFSTLVGGQKKTVEAPSTRPPGTASAGV